MWSKVYRLSTQLNLQMFISMSHWSWFKPLASATDQYRSSLGLLWGTLSLPCVMDILQLWLCKTGPLHVLQQFIVRVDVGVGQLKALDLGLGSIGISQLPHTHATRDSSPMLTLSGWLIHCHGRQGTGPALWFSCPWGQLTRPHTTRASSPMLTPLGWLTQNS